MWYLGCLVCHCSRLQIVGDIIKVLDGEEFPCDLILLSSALESEECYITTMNLDGETNLKVPPPPHEAARAV